MEEGRDGGWGGELGREQEGEPKGERGTEKEGRERKGGDREGKGREREREGGRDGVGVALSEGLDCVLILQVSWILFQNFPFLNSIT